ncbi:MAG: HTH-type transcriptional repressor FabR [Gammaproteobacteria bacterium]|nr:HTH-type transcriptional repressor FabR [Gammaproteobacteria bacterium]
MSGNRSIKKEQTRRALIDAALNQLSAERSFASLSLREVTREAGIAPTSFYRHFQNMEALGLTLVDESGLTLRQLMRQARQRIESGGSAIRTSVETFMEFISRNENIFRLLLRERSGTSRDFRAAIAREIAHFSLELADYIEAVTRRGGEFARIQADAMVILVFNAGAEALDMTAAQRKQLVEKTIRQLRMLDAGVSIYLKRSQNRENSRSNAGN